MEEGERIITIKCPCCGHRLFDTKTDTRGAISIKCPKCKMAMAVRIRNKRILVMPSK